MHLLDKVTQNKTKVAPNFFWALFGIRLVVQFCLKVRLDFACNNKASNWQIVAHS